MRRSKSHVAGAHAEDRLDGIIAAAREASLGGLVHIAGGGPAAYDGDLDVHVVAGVRPGNEVTELLVHLLQA